MAKRKHGLHRKVSSIFDGVPIPRPLPDAASPPHSISGDGKPTPKTPPHQQPAFTQKTDDDITKSPALVRHRPVTPVPTIKKGKYKLSAPIPGISDRKRKTQLALVPVLFIILVLVIISVYGTGTTTQIADKDSQAEVKTGKIGTDNSTVKINWKIPDPYSARFVDPMVQDRPKNIAGVKIAEEHVIEQDTAYEGENTTHNSEDITRESIVINSILYSSLESSIVIGDDILYEGDAISGVTIIKINKDNVLFEKEGKQFTVHWQRQNP